MITCLRTGLPANSRQASKASLSAIREKAYGAVLDLDEAHALLLPAEPRYWSHLRQYPSERWYQLLSELAPPDPIRDVAEAWVQNFQAPPALVLDESRRSDLSLARKIDTWLSEHAVGEPTALQVVVGDEGRATAVTLHMKTGSQYRGLLRVRSRQAARYKHPPVQAALAAGFLAREVVELQQRLERLLAADSLLPDSVTSQVRACLNRTAQAVSVVAATHEAGERRAPASAGTWMGESIPVDATSRTSRAQLLEDRLPSCSG